MKKIGIIVFVVILVLGVALGIFAVYNYFTSRPDGQAYAQVTVGLKAEVHRAYTSEEKALDHPVHLKLKDESEEINITFCCPNCEDEIKYSHVGTCSMVFYCSCPNQKTDETSNHKNFLCFIFSSLEAANEAERKAEAAEKEKSEKKSEAEKKAAEAKQASDAAAAVE